MKRVGQSKKWPRVLFAFSAIFAVVMGLALLVATRPISISPQITQPTTNETAPIEFAWPNVGSAAIGTLDGGLKSTYGSDAQKPTASIAKTITVLVVLDKYPLAANEVGPIITMGADDVKLFEQTVADDGTNLPVTYGLELTLRNMIDGIMLSSANNLADSLAIWAFGSLEEYQTAAEAWLSANNLNDTTIGPDASGLDPATTSTPTDLFQIGVLALQNPTLRQVVAQESAKFPEVGTIENTDALVGEDGWIGIKTGYTPTAGACFLFAVDYEIGEQTKTIVGVVTGQSTPTSRFTVAQKLVSSAQQNLVDQTLVNAGDSFANYTAPWGPTVVGIADTSLSTIGWSDQSIPISTSANAIDLSYTSGEVVGVITAGDSQVDLILDAPLTQPGLWWRVTHLGQLDWKF